MTHPPLYERTHILVGDDGLARLRAAHVLVCGLGGVGGYAAEALGRAGVGRLTVIDHDVVAATNLNRQLLATTETIGEQKIAVMARRLEAINPDCRVAGRDLFLTTETICSTLDELRPDWVLDAIDALNSKVSLIAEARARGLPVISCMGAGGRLTPTGLVVGDLMDSRTCPLARSVRNRLRRRGIERGVLAVWSPEQPRPHRPAEPTGRGRDRVVNGTISYLPAIFGLTMAAAVIQRLLDPEGREHGAE